jgi:hypothetical protein
MSSRRIHVVLFFLKRQPSKAPNTFVITGVVCLPALEVFVYLIQLRYFRRVDDFLYEETKSPPRATLIL